MNLKIERRSITSTNTLIAAEFDDMVDSFNSMYPEKALTLDYDGLIAAIIVYDIFNLNIYKI